MWLQDCSANATLTCFSSTEALKPLPPLPRHGIHHILPISMLVLPIPGPHETVAPMGGNRDVFFCLDPLGSPALCLRYSGCLLTKTLRKYNKSVLD